MIDKNIHKILHHNFLEDIFPTKYRLIPNLNELYELELAYYEKQVLTEAELIRNAAYFSQLGDTLTRHFLMCTGESLKLPEHSSSRLRSFFEKNLFRTGYATHGLFPYRGKFHPQMIKGLINIMGLKPGHTVLDPMMGSGTVLVEACLMGIRSIGVDISPFCRFMSQTKLDALTMNLTRAQNALNKHEEVFDYFANRIGRANAGEKIQPRSKSKKVLTVMESEGEYADWQDPSQVVKKQKETSDTYNFLLLAYLDSVGYTERSKKKEPVDQFKAILERYLFVAEKIQKVLAGTATDLAPAKVLEGDARDLPLESSTVDGIIFSPPYSFAIDYLKNDSFHLDSLGADMQCLRDSMVGLRGKTLSEKFRLYKEDMAKILAECSRVLRSGSLCTIIIGTNNNQIGKALGISPEEVPGLHEILMVLGSKNGLRQVKVMRRAISGISNTMRNEYIVILQKI